MFKLKKITGNLIGFILILIWSAKALWKYDSYVLSIYFHNPSVFLFRGIIQYLRKNNFTFISEDQYYEIVCGNEEVKERLVFISFDDGWKGNLKLLSIIEKYEIPVTVFIPVEPVISGNFWWEYIPFLKKEYPEITNDEDLKVIPNRERLKYIQKASSQYHIKRSAITLKELERLNKNPLITIGSHTYHHPITTMCTDEELNIEYAESKATLEKWLNTSVNSFSYPNGDYNKRDMDLLRKSNYKMAFTTSSDVIKDRIDTYQIPRISINTKGGVYENIARMLGLWDQYITPIHSRLKSERKPTEMVADECSA
jgi:peptidoglycan/xylan/chitin deacetylase (PgdA/CDA1 family)